LLQGYKTPIQKDQQQNDQNMTTPKVSLALFIILKQNFFIFFCVGLQNENE
jgi:hypothetical protein